MVDSCVKIRVEPCNISFVNWVIEGYEHLAVVSTLDRKEGLLVIRSTPDMFADVLAVLKNFNFSVEFVQ